MSIEQFARMVNTHDLTYMYSDDSAANRRGEASLSAIRSAAKQLPEDEVTRIWNAMVDQRMSDQAIRQSFYWRG